MGRVELRLAPIPFDLPRRCALLGLTTPPEQVRRSLDEDGRRAFAELAELIHAGATIGMVLRRDHIAPAVDRVNASLRRGDPWSDRWTVPETASDDPYSSRAARRGRDPLGLDVPALWAVADLAERFNATAVGFNGAKNRRREEAGARRAYQAADYLVNHLARVTGWGRATSEKVATATIDAAWRQLDIAMNAPFAPRIEWTLIVDAATHRATRFYIVNGGPELPHAG